MGLLFATYVNFPGKLLNLERALRHFTHGCRYFVEANFPIAGVVDGFLDERKSIADCLRTTLRQVANLLGDHGKAHAGFPSTSGFYSGIERKDVRLEGDFNRV